jgi:hypothetical protein
LRLPGDAPSLFGCPPPLGSVTEVIHCTAQGVEIDACRWCHHSLRCIQHISAGTARQPVFNDIDVAILQP